MSMFLIIISFIIIGIIYIWFITSIAGYIVDECDIGIIAYMILCMLFPIVIFSEGWRKYVRKKNYYLIYMNPKIILKEIVIFFKV